MGSTYAAAFEAAAHVFIGGAFDDVLDAGGDGSADLSDELMDELCIEGPDGHHLARVRRLRAGEHITVADGCGRWRPYRIDSITERALALVAIGAERFEEEPAPALAVAFALTKGMKPETVVRQLTELGVDEILPVVAHRSISRPRAERIDAVDQRLLRVAREAAMQSRRARSPRVAALGPLAELAGRPGLVIAERSGATLGDLGDPGPAGWTLVVGPEGGLAREDLEALAGAPRLAVGPHVLRAETAAVAVAAALSARRGGPHEAGPSEPG